MHENRTFRVKGILYEPCAGREVLEQILIVDVVHLDDLVDIAFEQFLVQRQPQHGEDMRDVAVLQRLLAS